MSKIFIGKEGPKQKDFNIIIENISKKQKEIIEKIKNKFNNFDSEKRKYKLKMLSILWSTYLLTIGSLEDKEFSNEDFNLIKSPTSEEEKDKFNDFIPILNTIQNSNLMISNKQSQELYEASLLKMEKKKSDLKILLNNKEKDEKEDKKEIKISTCIFCTEEFEENDIMNPEIMECKKHVHGNCFINYIEEELNNNRFPIRCPLCAGKERHEINYKTIIDCLLLNDKDNLAVKLENISLNHLAENNSDEITFCPTAGCNYMCSYDKNEFHLNCPMCKKSYCLQCKTEWHKGMTCEEYQITKNKDENDVKFEEYAKGSKLKQCPKCKRWVEKIDGCDHISCPCGTPFCYRCGRIKESEDDHGCRYCENNIFGNGSFYMNLNRNRNYIRLFNNNQGGGLFGSNYYINNYQGDFFGYNNYNDNIYGYQNNDSFIYNNINNQNNNLFINDNNNTTQNNNILFPNNNNAQRGGLFDNNIINNQGNSLFDNNSNNNNNHNHNQGLFGINNNINFVGNENDNNNSNHSIFGTNNNNQNSSEGNDKMFLIKKRKG